MELGGDMGNKISTTRNGFNAESYQRIPSVLLNDLKRTDDAGKPILEHTDIVVYALLKAHALQKPDCYPGHDALAREAGCSPATIQRSLQRLETAKHIMRKSNTATGRIEILTDVQGGAVIRRSLAPVRRSNPFRSRASCEPPATDLPNPTRVNPPAAQPEGNSDDAPF
jgi:DNA-binding MarR family transcriptional regulator